VLLSSHLLREIEVIADHLVVIGDGRVLADGSRQELLTGVDGGLETLFLRLTAANAREDVA
jgi:ABC-2 type transport system ATP-binding protein